MSQEHDIDYWDRLMSDPEARKEIDAVLLSRARNPGPSVFSFCGELPENLSNSSPIFCIMKKDNGIFNVLEKLSLKEVFDKYKEVKGVQWIITDSQEVIDNMSKANQKKALLFNDVALTESILSKLMSYSTN